MQKRTFLAAALLMACPLAASAQDAPAALPAPAAAPNTAAAPTTAPLPAATPAPTVTLRLKFTPGQTLYYSITSDSDGLLLTGQSGAGFPIKNHMEMLMHQTVKDIRATDGAATLVSGIDSMTMTMNGQTIPIPEDKLALMKTVGTTVVLPTGKTLSFTPNAALTAGSAMPGMDLSRANAFGGLGQLPDAPVKAGDTWKSAVAMGLMGAKAASSFSLTSVDTTGCKTVAVIDQTTDGTFDTSAADGAAVKGPFGMSLQGNVKGTGALRFDVDAGSMESSVSHLSMEMNLGAANPTGGMKIQMKIAASMKRAEAPTTPAPAPLPTAQ